MRPDLDAWAPAPALRVRHERTAPVDPDRLWRAAESVRVCDTRVLGRVLRWRIPGTPRDIAFRDLFRTHPFLPLEEREHALLAGLCGRIWTLRRDYPRLGSPEDFREWDQRGTVRVVFANWVEEREGRAAIVSEARVVPVDRQARLRTLSLRPLVATFGGLIGSEPLALAAARARRAAD